MKCESLLAPLAFALVQNSPGRPKTSPFIIFETLSWAQRNPLSYFMVMLRTKVTTGYKILGLARLPTNSFGIPMRHGGCSSAQFNRDE